MRSIIRLVIYTLLVGGALVLLGSYPETRTRLQFQITLFVVLSGYMLVLIRQGQRVNLGIVPEALYLVACAYVAVASALRLSAIS